MQALRVSSLTSDLERVRQNFRVPGMAVVAVQRGQVVFRQGFGLGNIDKNIPFTPETIGLVASTTKSITAGLVGVLVDEGTLEWTRPIREYWSEFKMVDEIASQEMTLEDMMCHRSGLPYHENLLAHGVGRELPNKGREFRQDLLKRLAQFEPSHAFRTHFQYQDIVYNCVGAIIELVTGEDYESLVKRHILDPVEMNNSTFSRGDVRETGRLAQGYGVVDGETTAIPFCDTRYLAPTAGLYSSADDMAKWVQLQLDQGRIGDHQIISEESMSWIRCRHMIVSADHPYYGGGALNYGQGWMLHNFRGFDMISHPGSFNGFRTNISYIPEKDLGVVVLSNLNLSMAMYAASLVTMDHLVGLNDVDHWIEHYKNLEKDELKVEADTMQLHDSERDLSNKHRHHLQSYSGSFCHPGYGTFNVELHKGSLRQTYDSRTFNIKPYNGETFETRFQSTENHIVPITMTFESADDGKVIALRIAIVPGITPPRFIRKE